MEEKIVSIRKSLAAGDGAFGVMAFDLLVPGLPHILSATGLDFILYDMEHSGAGFETMKQQFLACNALGIAPLARLPAAEYHFVARALDAGARGVMLPMVSGAAHARRIVSHAKYPPRGVRGYAGSLAHNGYRQVAPLQTMKEADQNGLVICQIETVEGLENVEEIAAVEGVDVLWVGHFDLTISMGIPGDFKHPRFHEAIARIVAAAQKHGKHAGFLAMDDEAAREYWAKGFRMMGYSSDTRLLQGAVARGIGLLRSLG